MDVRCNVTHTYDLKAVIAGGRELALVTKLPEPGHALYLEQALAAALTFNEATKETGARRGADSRRSSGTSRA